MTTRHRPDDHRTIKHETLTAGRTAGFQLLPQHDRQTDRTRTLAVQGQTGK
jgi:hypothetical protein